MILHTKTGEIEACCEWVASLVMVDCFDVDNRYVYGSCPVPGWTFAAFESSMGGNFEIRRDKLNFCPNCGKKTEIEGD